MVTILKATGEKELFDRQKLCNSIIRSGAPEDLAFKICKRVGEKITPGISTSRIFRQALRELVKTDREVAARYSLHRGIAALGPAGFVFEQYIEAILQAYGYKTRRDTIMQGRCITHEIDLIATEGPVHYLLELKYHNESGIRTHVPVVMYADARLADISKVENKKERGRFIHRMWLITNTKFTETAIAYAKCKRIELTGWNYPAHNSLEDMINRKKLYPVTILPSITAGMLEILAKKNIVLAQDLGTYSIADLVEIGFSEIDAAKVISEVRGIFS